MREFYREPETLFWVYGFPLILALGLGFAFRDRPPEPAQVDVVETADGTAEALKQCLENAHLDAEVHPLNECWKRFRRGKTALFVEVLADGFHYYFDQARPESMAARCEVNAAIVRSKADVTAERMDHAGPGEATGYRTPGANGRCWQTVDEPVKVPGNRYIDFLIPGLMGLNIMGGGLYGVGFLIVDMRSAQTSQASGSHPHAPQPLFIVDFGRPVGAAVTRDGRSSAGRLAGIHRTSARQSFHSGPGHRRRRLVLRRPGSPAGLTHGQDRNDFRTPQPDHDSRLYRLRHVLQLEGAISQVVQPLIQALPLTQLNNALREVILDRATLGQVGWRVAALAAWGGVTFLLALKWFRWQ